MDTNKRLKGMTTIKAQIIYNKFYYRCIGHKYKKLPLFRSSFRIARTPVDKAIKNWILTFSYLSAN